MFWENPKFYLFSIHNSVIHVSNRPIHDQFELLTKIVWFIKNRKWMAISRIQRPVHQLLHSHIKILTFIYIIQNILITHSILLLNVLLPKFLLILRAGQGFWHPDPIMPHYFLPQPGPDQKIVNFMAPTLDRPNYILPDQTETIYHQPEINKPQPGIHQFQTTINMWIRPAMK